MTISWLQTSLCRLFTLQLWYNVGVRGLSYDSKKKQLCGSYSKVIKGWPAKPELLLIHWKHISQPCILTRQCSSVCRAVLVIQYFFIWFQVRIREILLKVTKGRRALIDRASSKLYLHNIRVSARNEEMSQFAWKPPTWLSNNKYNYRVKAFLSIWLVKPPTAGKIRFPARLATCPSPTAWVRNTMVSAWFQLYFIPGLTLWSALGQLFKVNCNSNK